MRCSVASDATEPALLEHPNRRGVADGNIRVERPRLVDACHELCERGARDATTPERATEPIADESLASLGPAHDVAGDRAALLDGLLLHGAGPEHVRDPVHQEGIAIARWEARHRVRCRLALVLEEHVEILFDDVAKLHVEVGRRATTPRHLPVPVSLVTDAIILQGSSRGAQPPSSRGVDGIRTHVWLICNQLPNHLATTPLLFER